MNGEIYKMQLQQWGVSSAGLRVHARPQMLRVTRLTLLQLPARRRRRARAQPKIFLFFSFFFFFLFFFFFFFSLFFFFFSFFFFYFFSFFFFFFFFFIFFFFFFYFFFSSDCEGIAQGVRFDYSPSPVADFQAEAEKSVPADAGSTTGTRSSRAACRSFATSSVVPEKTQRS
jgi:hypothetical protein